VTLGLLILLFVAYQLWGTGIITARAQQGLKHDFAKAQQTYAAEHTSTTTLPDPTSTTIPGPTTTTTQPVRPAPPVPAEGDVEGVIRIPHASVNLAFVEGVSRDDLKKGPGHYPDTPMPGTLGNAAIAGHRTTYGAPFWDIDKLKPGDDIIIETVAGKFTYKVYDPDPSDGVDLGHLIVKPTDLFVVDNTLDAQLTLTSCNPKFSAEQRIVIKARLAPNESAKPTKPQPRKVTRGGRVRSHDALAAEGLSGQQRSATPAVRWGLAVLLVGLAWWWAFRRWRHPITWVVGVIPFIAVLFAFYVYFEQALPAGY
jgi:sortase A